MFASSPLNSVFKGVFLPDKDINFHAFYNHQGKRNYVVEFTSFIKGTTSGWRETKVTNDLVDRLNYLSAQNKKTKEEHPCISLLSVREEEYGKTWSSNAILALMDFDRLHEKQTIIDLCIPYGGPKVKAGTLNPDQCIQLRNSFAKLLNEHFQGQVGNSISGNPKVMLLLEWDVGRYLNFPKTSRFLRLDKLNPCQAQSVRYFKENIKKVLWEHFYPELLKQKGLPLALLDCMDSSDGALTKNFVDSNTFGRWQSIISNLKPINISKHWESHCEKIKTESIDKIKNEAPKNETPPAIIETRKNNYFRYLKDEFNDQLPTMHPEYKKCVNRLFPIYKGEIPFYLKKVLKNKNDEKFFDTVLRTIIGMMQTRPKFDLPANVISLNVNYVLTGELGYRCDKLKDRNSKRISRFLKELIKFKNMECIAKDAQIGVKGYTYRLRGDLKKFAMKVGIKIGKAVSSVNLRKPLPEKIEDGKWHQSLLESSAHFIRDPFGFLEWFKKLKGSGVGDREKQARNILKYRLEKWMDYRLANSHSQNDAMIDYYRDCYAEM